MGVLVVRAGVMAAGVAVGLLGGVLVGVPAASAVPGDCAAVLTGPVGASRAVSAADRAKIRECAKGNRQGGIIDVLINDELNPMTPGKLAVAEYAKNVMRVFDRAGCVLLTKTIGADPAYRPNRCNVAPVSPDASGQTSGLTVRLLTQR